MNRKEFLHLTTAATGGFFFGGATESAESKGVKEKDTKRRELVTEEYILINARLEEYFIYNEKGQVKATQTGLYDLHIKAGKIVSITRAIGSVYVLPRWDAKGKLLLPGLRDMHVHIDKTFYGEPWNAEPLGAKTVKDMIALERRILPDLLLHSTEKAEMAIDLMNSKGTYFARCQTNIEPTSGLKSLENLQKALANKKEAIQTEIVAFPQHGILYSDAEGILREAAQMGVDYIGGLDPTTVDGDMKKSLDVMFQIALDYDKGIDIHLHEGKATGLPAIEYMIAKVRENKALQGKTFISHGFALGQLEVKETEAIGEQLAEVGIGIISTVPLGKLNMPLPMLYKHQVQLMTGTDSIIDHWSPFGSCDMLEKAKLTAELYGWRDEFTLSRALQIATKNQLLPLNAEGKQVWPLVGDEASFILVEASCSAEAVARIPVREAVFNRGKLVYFV
ncbi:amidohydrolase [Myroides odoratus]|uniref:amidohydrolase n=1 Tax=Myroides odoratus TaxID=256 RepID=UPI0039B003D0